MNIENFNQLRCANAFLGALIGSFAAPAMIKIQGQLQQNDLAMFMLLASVIEMLMPVFVKIPKSIKLFGPPVQSVLVGVLAIVMVLKQQVFLLAVLITLYPALGIMYQLRANYINELLKSQMNLESVTSKIISAGAIGSLAGFGLNYVASKMGIQSLQTICLGCTADVIIAVSIDLLVAVIASTYSK